MTTDRPNDANRNSKPKIVYLKDESLYLVCEWGDCQHESSEMGAFANHVRGHLKELTKTNLKCLWADCGFVSYTKEETIRHVTFHPYHVKLKCLGTRFLERAVAMKCSLGDDARNFVPELPEEFHCLWEDCMTLFNDTCEFYDHTNQHVDMCPKGKPRGGIPCLWDGCNGMFENQRRLRDHLHTHTQEKLAACSVCGGLFANRTKFVDHVRRQKSVSSLSKTNILAQDKELLSQVTIVTEPEIYQCSHCSKQFSSERLLRDHMRMHVNHYKCPYCDMTTPTPSSLNIHVKYRHSNEKPFACTNCNYKAKAHYDLRRHLLTHSAEVPHKCPYSNCGYETRSDCSLARHIKKLHEGIECSNYKCHICESCFSRGAYLTKHLIVKHKYRRPSGHSRFRYKADSDGYWRLQTVRYESIELSQEIANGEDDDDIDSDDAAESDTEETDENTQAASSGNVIRLPLDMLQDSQGTLVISFQTDEDGSMVMQTVARERNVHHDAARQCTDQTDNALVLEENS